MKKPRSGRRLRRPVDDPASERLCALLEQTAPTRATVRGFLAARAQGVGFGAPLIAAAQATAPEGVERWVNGNAWLAAAHLDLWSQAGRGVYELAPELWRSLVGSDLDAIPVEALRRLPEVSPYLTVPAGEELPGAVYLLADGVEAEARTRCLGVWATLDPGDEDSETGMTIHMTLHAEGIAPYVARLPLEATMSASAPTPEDSEGMLAGIWGDAARYALSEDEREHIAAGRVALADLARAVLSLLLWLASPSPEIAPRRPSRGAATRPAALAPLVWDVGARTGAALRDLAREVESVSADLPPASPDARRGPRPHLRRGHWRGVWCGPLAGERRLEARWIAPTVVNASTSEGTPLVIRNA